VLQVSDAKFRLTRAFAFAYIGGCNRSLTNVKPNGGVDSIEIEATESNAKQQSSRVTVSIRMEDRKLLQKRRDERSKLGDEVS
jgi:hypothetical protein